MPFIVTAATDSEEKAIAVRPSQAILDAIAAAFERPVEEIEEALLGDDAVQPGESFEQWGIEVTVACRRTLTAPWGLTLALFFSRVWQDGARLHVRLRAAKATVEEVAAEIATLNPGVSREALMKRVKVDPEDASRVNGVVDWNSKGIAVLPESIGDLTVGGYLYLDYNKLATLPASFGDLKVGKKVHLDRNPVAASRPRFDGLRLVY